MVYKFFQRHVAHIVVVPCRHFVLRIRAIDRIPQDQDDLAPRTGLFYPIRNISGGKITWRLFESEDRWSYGSLFDLGVMVGVRMVL